MNTIAFSYNWNNKLFCNCFTTFRVYKPEIHIPGHYFLVQLNFKTELPNPFIAELVCVNVCKLRDVTPSFSLIDTGYCLHEFTKLINTMYKKNKDYVEFMDFVQLTFRRKDYFKFPLFKYT